MVHYIRRVGETDEQLLMRMATNKELDGHSWDDIAAEMNRLTGHTYAESTYRKKYTAFSAMFNGNKDTLVGPDAGDKLDSKLREIEQAKIQFQDERRSWQKQNYVAARVEQKLDYLEEVLQDLGERAFHVGPCPDIQSNNDVLCVLSDLHIGETFARPGLGEYNSDIAKGRLSEYLGEVLEVAKLHKSQDLYVALVGDLISGNIHKSIQVSNRENVIDQVKLASEYITAFIAAAAEHFPHVYVVGVAGNHSRIDRKEDAMHDERLDNLILWIVKNMLSHVDNVYVQDSNIDSGITFVDIRGKGYVVVHGDYDSMTDAGIGRLCSMLGHVPDNIVLGHNHTAELKYHNGTCIIRGGSLPGSGDQYTVEHRLCGRATQMCCVVNANGVVCAYPVQL